MACIDSDDMWKPEKLAKQVALLESRRQYKACFTWDEVLHEEGVGPWGLPDDYSEMENRSRYAWFYFFFRWGNRINACSMLMEKDVYLELGGFNPYLRTLGDYCLWLLLAARYPFYLIPEKLTYYRRHASNNSSESGPGPQYYIEDYLCNRSLIVDMPADFFARAFSDMLFYADLENPLVLAAEKIVALLSCNRIGYDQLALEIYIAHAALPGFVELMEERYFLDDGKLDGLLRNCGLASANAGKPHGYEIAPAPNRTELLLRDHAAGALTPETLGKYSYSFLFDLLEAAEQAGEDDPRAESLRAAASAFVAAQRRRCLERERRTVVLLVGVGSAWNSAFLYNEFVRPDADDVYYAVLPRKSDIQNGYLPDGYRPPEGTKTLEVFLSGEYYLRSCIEAGVHPDLLICIDCLNSEYPWEDMMRKHPASVLCMKQNSGPEGLSAGDLRRWRVL